MEKLNKKGQLGGLQPIIITLVVVGVLLGIAFLLLDEFKDQVSTYQQTVTDETVDVTDAGIWLKANDTYTSCFTKLKLTDVSNESTGVAVTGYTISDAGLLVNTTAPFGKWNVSYTYYEGRGGCTAVENTTDAINEIPTWLTIIVILVIVGIVLAIVFNVLPSSGGSGGFGFGKGSSGTIAEI